MTKVFNTLKKNLIFVQSWLIFPIFGANKNFQKNHTVMHIFTWVSSNMRKYRKKTEDSIPRKCQDWQKEERSNERLSRPYVIGPFW